MPRTLTIRVRAQAGQLTNPALQIFGMVALSRAALAAQSQMSSQLRFGTTLDSGGSQLFMNVNDNNVLNWYTPGDSKHPVFGKCIDEESFNVMVAISQVPTQNDRPVTPVKVSSVQVGLPSGAAVAAAAAAAAASTAAPEAPNRARQSAGRPAEPSQPSPTLASPSTPEGISWADKESKDW